MKKWGNGAQKKQAADACVICGKEHAPEGQLVCGKCKEKIKGSGEVKIIGEKKKPTNRFYYSAKQANIWGYNNANKVYNGKEWLDYSEWISKKFMDKTSNWDDAVLVLETDEDFPPIEINPNRARLFYLSLKQSKAKT